MRVSEIRTFVRESIKKPRKHAVLSRFFGVFSLLLSRIELPHLSGFHGISVTYMRLINRQSEKLRQQNRTRKIITIRRKNCKKKEPATVPKITITGSVLFYVIFDKLFDVSLYTINRLELCYDLRIRVPVELQVDHPELVLVEKFNFFKKKQTPLGCLPLLKGEMLYA